MMFGRSGLFAWTTVAAVVVLLFASSPAVAQVDDRQARSYLTYKLSQAVNVSWKLFSRTVAQVGTAQEKAALARMQLAYAKDDFGAPKVTIACDGSRCTLRMNASFVGLSSIFAVSGAASAHLKAAPGLAVSCFADNVDSLAQNVLKSSAGNPYVPLLPCLGKSDAVLQELIDNQRYNDLADIAMIETLAFAFAHELAHIKNGDLDRTSDTARMKEEEVLADLAAVEFLARAEVDSFFGAGAAGVFRLAEELSVRGAGGTHPASECRMLYAVFAGGYFLMNLDRSKLAFSTAYEKDLRFAFYDWKIAEAANFVEGRIAKAKDGFCGKYFN